MKQYVKDGQIRYLDQITITKDGLTTYNPSEEMVLANGWTEYVAPQPSEEELLAQARQNKLSEIEAYDTSEAVNSFEYNGAKMWFSKADRVGLRNSLNIEKREGRTMSTMWFETTPITISIDEGLALLDAIELYALECYNITASHKAEVSELQTIEEVEAYDITKDYPKVLSL